MPEIAEPDRGFRPEAAGARGDSACRAAKPPDRQTGPGSSSSSLRTSPSSSIS